MAAKDFKIKVVLKGEDRTKNLSRSIGKLSRSMASAAKTAAIGAVGIGYSAAKMLQPYYELEDALASVGTIAPATFGSVEADQQRVEDGARAWAKAHTDGASDYVRTSYQMISAGLDTAQAIAGTETAMRVAKATMGESAEAASLLGVMYNNLGDKTKDARIEMGRIGDVVTKTQQLFQISDLNQLTEGLKYGVPVAKQFGMTLEQTANIIGQLNTAGLAGSQAGTSFASAMSKMIPAAKKLGIQIAKTDTGGVDFIGTLDNLKAKYGKFGDMSDKVKDKFQQAFSQRGIRAVALMMGKTDDLRRSLDSVTNSTGAAEAAQIRMESTGSAKWKKLMGNIHEVGFEIAGKLAPKIEAFIPKFEDMGNMLATNFDRVSSIVGKLATVYIGGKLITAVKLLAANPAWLAFSATVLGMMAVLDQMETTSKRGARGRAAVKLDRPDRGNIFDSPEALRKWQEKERAKRSGPRTSSGEQDFTNAATSMPVTMPNGTVLVEIVPPRDGSKVVAQTKGEGVRTRIKDPSLGFRFDVPDYGW